MGAKPVKFEVLGGGRTLSAAASDPRMGAKREILGKTDVINGLVEPHGITVDVSGVNRLTLVVHDADDGNKADAADWLEPRLVMIGE